MDAALKQKLLSVAIGITSFALICLVLYYIDIKVESADEDANKVQTVSITVHLDTLTAEEWQDYSKSQTMSSSSIFQIYGHGRPILPDNEVWITDTLEVVYVTDSPYVGMRKLIRNQLILDKRTRFLFNECGYSNF